MRDDLFVLKAHANDLIFFSFMSTNLMSRSRRRTNKSVGKRSHRRSKTRSGRNSHKKSTYRSSSNYRSSPKDMAVYTEEIKRKIMSFIDLPTFTVFVRSKDNTEDNTKTILRIFKHKTRYSASLNTKQFDWDVGMVYRERFEYWKALNTTRGIGPYLDQLGIQYETRGNDILVRKDAVLFKPGTGALNEYDLPKHEQLSHLRFKRFVDADSFIRDELKLQGKHDVWTVFKTFKEKRSVVSKNMTELFDVPEVPIKPSELAKIEEEVVKLQTQYQALRAKHSVLQKGYFDRLAQYEHAISELSKKMTPATEVNVIPQLEEWRTGQIKPERPRAASSTGAGITALET